MTVGSLGKSIVFSVSSKTVKTIKSMTWKRAYNYSVHKMYGRKGILEYTGSDPDEIEFEMEISALLGVNPISMIQNLENMAQKHAVVKFILGNDVIGTDWVITSTEIKSERYYMDGTMLTATLKVKIKEYAPEE